MNRLITLLALGGLGACSDSSGPALEGPSFFSVTLDGHTWVPDTVTGVFYQTSPDSGTLNLFAVRTGPASIETVASAIAFLSPTAFCGWRIPWRPPLAGTSSLLAWPSRQAAT